MRTARGSESSALRTSTRTRTQAGRSRTQRPARGGTTRDATRKRTKPQRRDLRDSDQRGRTTAAQKAYARRAQRTAVVEHSDSRPQAQQGVLSMLRLRMPQSRASFVLLIMSLLSAGVVLTLWLSTQAIADSYRLESIRAETAGLAERAERLQREVARQESAAVLAQKAKALGMVPSGEPARLLVTPHGKPKLFGEPKVVARPRPPAPPPPKKKQRATQDDQRTDDGTERARPAEEDQQAQAQAAPAPDADDGAEGAEGGQ